MNAHLALVGDDLGARRREHWRALSITLGFVVLAALAAIWAGLARGRLAPLVSSSGTISVGTAPVGASIAGRLRTIAVREGDLVSAGQVIAIMDTYDIGVQLSEARLRVEATSAAYTAATATIQQRDDAWAAARASVAQRRLELQAAQLIYERSMRELGEDPARDQLKDARVVNARAALAAAELAETDAKSSIAVASAQADVASAEHEAALAEALQLARLNENAYVKAPWGGRVRAVRAQPGEMLVPSQPVIDLEDPMNVAVMFSVPASASANIGDGSEVRVTVNTAPPRTFVAHVVRFTGKKNRLEVKALLDGSVDLTDGEVATAFIRKAPSTQWPSNLSLQH